MRRMPLPPPPATALSITGKPADRAKASASAGSVRPSSVPGTMGAPAAPAILPRAGLRAHLADGVGGGADEDHAGILAGRGEIRILAEEAVAGMDGLRAMLRAASIKLAESR